MTEKIYKWYDSLEDPYRFLIFFTCVLPWITLSSINDTTCKTIAIVTVMILLITRIYYLYKPR